MRNSKDFEKPFSIRVENIPETANEPDLYALFDKFGIIRSVEIKDGRRGRGGYGLVRMKRGDMRSAIQALDHTLYGGKIIRVKGSGRN